MNSIARKSGDAEITSLRKLWATRIFENVFFGGRMLSQVAEAANKADLGAIELRSIPAITGDRPAMVASEQSEEGKQGRMCIFFHFFRWEMPKSFGREHS